MQAAMNVGIFFGVGTLDGVEHLFGLLCRGAVVEIDQWLAVHLLRQDGKIGADARNVIGRHGESRRFGYYGHDSKDISCSLTPSQSAAARVSTLRRPSLS